MPFYAVQVKTGAERRFLAAARKGSAAAGARFHWPRRNLRIKQRGAWKDTVAPIFPGYLFVEADRIEPRLYASLHDAPGFLRFLLANDHIVPLDGDDRKLLSYFLAFGEIVDTSVAYFDERRRIRIVSGPLMGLEGQIVKVDRRKGRARVRLAMYQDSFEIDFGFASLEIAPAEGQRVSPPRAGQLPVV